MGLTRIRRLLGAAVAAALLALAATGCGGKDNELSQEAASTTPIPPAPCTRQPQGVAQDGVNDEQGGSTPGIDPCDGPGN